MVCHGGVICVKVEHGIALSPKVSCCPHDLESVAKVKKNNQGVLFDKS